MLRTWPRRVPLGVFFVAALLVAAGPARAEVTPSNAQRSINIWNSHADYLLDRTQALSFEAVRVSPNFVASHVEPEFGETPAAPVVAWLRFTPRPGWYLSLHRDVTRADVYYNVQGSYEHQAFGMLVPYAERSVQRLEPTVAFPSNVDVTKPAYLRLLLTYPGDTVHLSTPDFLAENDEHVRLVLVYPLIMLLSFCAALGLANLVIFWFVRDKALLVYAIAMASAVLLGFSSRPGIGWALLWPHFSMPILWPAQITLIAYYASVAFFTRMFLDLPKTNRLLDRVLMWSLATYVVLDVLVIWFLPSEAFWGFAQQVNSFSDAAYFSVVWITGVLAWASGRKTARFFVFAFSGVLLGLFTDVAIQWTNQSEISILFPFIGVAWEGLLLFAALADNFNTVSRERNQANNERAIAAEQRTAEIEYISLHDSLTGLSNRRGIEVELSHLAETSGSAPAHALAYVDLDHFNVVNDTFGHVAGDQLIVTAAEALRSAVAPGDSVARIGGDEFLVLMRDVPSMEAMSERAEHLRETIALMRMMWQEQTVPLSASIGVALARPGAADPGALMSLADAACAVAKDAGRNRVHCVSDETTAARARREMDWVGRITKAFDENRMRLYAQSIVPLATPQAGHRFEVLIRLVNGGDLVVEPSTFLPAAERFGLMPQIDAWVIEHALALCAPAAREGSLRSVSLNLSGAFLRLGNAQRIIEQAIEAASFPIERLCLEITETVVSTHLGDVVGLMRALGTRGARFSLDDFGTGSSSLALLKRLRLDYVKIDGSFVRDCVNNRIDSAILESVVRLAKLLQMRTVAEYVTDAKTATLLRELGVDYGQGWAFDRARPIEEIIAPLSASGQKTAG